MASPDLDTSLVRTAYARWAPIYDVVCGPVMVQGRRAAAAAARAVGGRILEVGVGTGLSFDDYDETTEVTGIDLSAPMLEKARAKMASGRYPHVRDVLLMDAHNLAFADASFDCVVAQFVITLVANPERVLSECHRVVKPGGRIILINHSIRRSGRRPPWNDGPRKRRGVSGCGRNFRSPGCRPGRSPARARFWWSGARSRRSASTRWFASSEPHRLRRDLSSSCHPDRLMQLHGTSRDE